MTRIYEFEKQGFKFCFRNPTWQDFYKKLVMQWKVIGIKENKENDGYFYNSEFMPTQNAMELSGVKINGKVAAGVGLPENLLSEIQLIHKQMQDNDLQKNLTKDIQYTLNDMTSYGIYNGISEFDITEIVKDLKEQLACYSFYPCNEDIAKVLTKDPEIEKIAINNYQSNPEGNWNDEYLNWFRRAVEKKQAPGHGLIPNQIIRQKISEIILAQIGKESKEKQKENNIFELAKQTGEKQVLEKWMEDCKDPKEECSTDFVVLYAMPDGTKKTERTHTW